MSTTLTHFEARKSASHVPTNTRKSNFAKRQKHFVRNFLTDQLSVNHYYLFPGNKNPLNPAPVLLRSQTNAGIFLKDPNDKRRPNRTKITDYRNLNNKSNQTHLSKTSHISQRSAPTYLSRSIKLKRDEDKKSKLPSLNLPNVSNDVDYLKELSFVHKKTDNQERDQILNAEMKKLQQLAYSQEKSSRERKFRKRTLSERFAIRQRFKRAVRKVIIILSMLEIHKIQVQRMLKTQSENWIHKTFKETTTTDSNELFDKHYYSRPKEPKFPDEAKRILRLKPEERTEEMLRFVQLSLNFCVPEFLTFPLHMQRKIAQLAAYQEFEPTRVVMREGHVPLYYYIVLTGNAIMSKAWNRSATRNQLDSNLKRGDCYGEIDIIKEQLRSHTITVYGNIPFGVLVIEKEDFFKIQTPVVGADELYQFLCNRVNFLKIISYPIEKLRNLPRHSCFSIYHRTGHTITEDSVKDEYLYIIKSGTCRVLKKVRFDNSALSFYQKEGISKREIIAQKQISLDNSDHIQKPLIQYERSGSKFIRKQKTDLNDTSKSINYKNKKQYTYLEIKKLDEGDIFGIHDLVFTDPKEVNSLILVSDGAECIHLRRYTFMDLCDGEALLRMKFNLPPYPNNESFIIKYFSYLQWGNFKHKVSKSQD